MDRLPGRITKKELKQNSQTYQFIYKHWDITLLIEAAISWCPSLEK